MSTSSVSRGCFVFKPSSKKRKRVGTETHFTRGCEEKDAGGALRYKLCRDLWDQILRDTESLQDELHRNILDSLLDFTRKSSPSAHAQCVWTAQIRASEIPTAALMLGVNVPDHDATFQSLSELLRRSVTPHVASLHAKECATLKHALKRVLERIMDGVGVALDDDDEEGGESDAPKLGRGVQCSFGTLCEWYKAKNKQKDHATERRDANPPVVVIFKDLESFSPKVLQDFILICSRYVSQLPLVFIFGIATSPSTIQNMLPHSVSSLLCIELFHSLSCTQHLATVIDKFILDAKFPFRLSGKVLQVLVSVFLYHDFSVRNFVKGLQVALLEHFHSQPLSVLCCPKNVALDLVEHLQRKDLERIRRLPSFRSHVQSLSAEERDELTTRDDALREECKKMIKSLHRYHKTFFPVLRCLHALTSTLPRFPLGKQIRELLLICLERRVWEGEEYGVALKLLRMFSRDQLEAGVQRCLQVLDPEKSKRMKRAKVQLQDLLSRMKDLDLNATGSTPAQDSESIVTSPLKNLQKKTDLFQLQKTLLEMHETRRTKKLSPFELLRNETVDLLDALVRAHLAPPESQPLHEVLYYRSSSTVRRHLNAAPRTSIQAALADPDFYLRPQNPAPDHAPDPPPTSASPTGSTWSAAASSTWWTGWRRSGRWRRRRRRRRRGRIPTTRRRSSGKWTR
ncbi:hypothetical protein NL108_017215 [Boleophthalmus pectinirostris]|nr:hypothetical protein NL108_017215 [Boleophthalmus pectinirostris]